MIKNYVVMDLELSLQEVAGAWRGGHRCWEKRGVSPETTGQAAQSPGGAGWG